MDILHYVIENPFPFSETYRWSDQHTKELHALPDSWLGDYEMEEDVVNSEENCQLNKQDSSRNPFLLWTVSDASSEKDSPDDRKTLKG